MSGVGKGTSMASMGKILQAKGYSVSAIKVDAYINVDAGTMNPVEHGEVFVTTDGDETDQDIGTYERFLREHMTKSHYMTTGRIYRTVIDRERNLEYGGKCVEVVPHIPEEIIRRIDLVADETKADFVMIEVGGTVGEYQNILFLEAARMMKNRDPDSVRFVIVSYLPVPGSIGEMKTKPTQYAVRTLNSAGIQPDFIIGRSTHVLDEPRKEKLAVHCSVPPENTISAPDVKSVYHVPIIFEDQGFADSILKSFGLKSKGNDFAEWRDFVNKIDGLTKTVKIGVIGKYFSTGDFVLSDAYISVLESIKHASWFHDHKPEIMWLNSEEYEQDESKLKELDDLDGVIIPGGFGSRGIEGKIMAIKYARENKIPYLGLCYGMQCAVIEHARNVLGWADAHTTEIDAKTSHPVIHLLPGQEENLKDSTYGGTLRLGAYDCKLVDGTKAREAYDQDMVSERHRHRYEYNNDFRDELEKSGLISSGINPEKDLVEIVEIKDHPFFVGVQFHPEFQTRPTVPHPLFRDFIKAAVSK